MKKQATPTVKSSEAEFHNAQKLNHIKQQLQKYREVKKNIENPLIIQKIQDSFPQSCREFNRKKDEEDCYSSNNIKQKLSQGMEDIPREITLADLQNFELERQSLELNKDAWKSVLMDQAEQDSNEEITFEELRFKHAAGLQQLLQNQRVQKEHLVSEKNPSNSKSNPIPLEQLNASNEININQCQVRKDNSLIDKEQASRSQKFNIFNEINILNNLTFEKEVPQSQQLLLANQIKPLKSNLANISEIPNNMQNMSQNNPSCNVKGVEIQLPMNSTSAKRKLNNLTLQTFGEYKNTSKNPHNNTSYSCKSSSITSSEMNNLKIQSTKGSSGLTSCRNNQEYEKQGVKQLSMLSSANTLQSLASSKLQSFASGKLDYFLDSKFIMSSNEHVVNDQPPSPIPLNQTTGLNKNNNQNINKSAEGDNLQSSLNKSAVGFELIEEKNDKSSSVSQQSQKQHAVSLHLGVRNENNSTPKNLKLQQKNNLFLAQPSNLSLKKKSPKLSLQSPSKNSPSMSPKPDSNNTYRSTKSNKPYQNTFNSSFHSHNNSVSNLKADNSKSINSSCVNSSNKNSSNNNNNIMLDRGLQKKVGSTTTKRTFSKDTKNTNNVEPYFKSARAKNQMNNFKSLIGQIKGSVPSRVNDATISEFARIGKNNERQLKVPVNKDIKIKEQDQGVQQQQQYVEEFRLTKDENESNSKEHENWQEEQKKWRQFGSEMVKAYEELSENFNRVINDKLKQQEELKDSENKLHQTPQGNKNILEEGYNSGINPNSSSSQKILQPLNASVSESILRLKNKLLKREFSGELSQDISIVLAELNRLNASNAYLQDKCHQVESAVSAHLNQSTQLADHIIHLRTQLDKASTKKTAILQQQDIILPSHLVESSENKNNSTSSIGNSNNASSVHDKITQDARNIQSSEFKAMFSHPDTLLAQQNKKQNNSKPPSLQLSLHHQQENAIESLGTDQQFKMSFQDLFQNQLSPVNSIQQFSHNSSVTDRTSSNPNIPSKTQEFSNILSYHSHFQDPQHLQVADTQLLVRSIPSVPFFGKNSQI